MDPSRVVIDGKDRGGITKTVNRQGGGGFRYFCIPPSLHKKGKRRNWLIGRSTIR